MNLTVAKLKVRTVKTLEARGPQTFSKLAKLLRVSDSKRLDNVLQDLRRTRQIYFAGPSTGWITGAGRVYRPMQRKGR